MEIINEEFNIPYYILVEINECLELVSQGECKTMKWENIKALLRLAKVNNRITKEQMDYIIEKYNRENGFIKNRCKGDVIKWI